MSRDRKFQVQQMCHYTRLRPSDTPQKYLALLSFEFSFDLKSLSHVLRRIEIKERAFARIGLPLTIVSSEGFEITLLSVK